MTIEDSSFEKRGAERPPNAALDLLAVEGLDTGRRFTIDSQEVAIFRGRGNEAGVIYLHDGTVSKQQALIRSSPAGWDLLHDERATNATCVNGEPISKRRIAAGDSIQIGRVVLDVHLHRGQALSALMNRPVQRGDSRPHSEIDSTEIVVAYRDLPTETTQVPAARKNSALYLSAYFGGSERVYPLSLGVNKVGRLETCQVRIPADQTRVSRHHLDLVVSGREATLLHRSAKSTTLLNGRRVVDQAQVSPGDVLEIGGVRFTLMSDLADEVTTIEPAPNASANGSLRARFEGLQELEAQIEREFRVVGSFLDIDVVGSSDMKRREEKPWRIVLSFERWRGWLRKIVEEFGGQTLNSNGDELMCFFEGESNAHRALLAGGAMLSRLERFNREENLLSTPFRLRLGAHTGESLVDRERGYAYSNVLGIAGHLQKKAATNGLLASESIHDALADPDLLERLDAIEGLGADAYQLRDELLRDEAT